MNERLSGTPYPEARGPHLPDVLTRQSPWVLAFGAVAALQLWQGWRLWVGFDGKSDVGATLSFVLFWIPSVVPPLLGVALFRRYPNARRTMPLLVFGLLLFAFRELLSAFQEPIRAVLRTITPVAEDRDFGLDTPAELAFRVFTGSLALFALLYTAAGISSTRSRERTAAERPLAVWLVVLAIVSSVISVGAITQVEFDPTPAFLLQLAIGTVLSALLTLGWAYLVTVTVGGWLSAESPLRAWGLAAIAASTLFVSGLLFTLLTSLMTGEPGLSILRLVGYASLVAWVLLLAAFWLGLPSPRDPVADASPDEPTVDPREATQPGSAAG